VTQAYEITEVEGSAPPSAATSASASAAAALARLDPAMVARLDEVLLAMRRISVKPPLMTVTLPGTTRRIDFAKLLACAAIDGLSSGSDPVTVKSVAATLDLEHSTASRLLTEAETEGLLERHTHPTDRRSSVLVLTALGQEIADGFRQARLRFIAGALTQWSAKDVAVFTDLLGRFVNDVVTQKNCWAEWVSDDSTPGR
jgi:DNA-binding MarR family transcriptional regulator